VSDAVVVDTNVLSWLLDQRTNPLRDRYRSLIDDRGRPRRFPERDGAVATERRTPAGGSCVGGGWSEALGELTVIQPDDALVSVCAELRHVCEQAGQGLGAKAHDGDRWVAATALRRQAALVAHDRIFVGAPGLQLLTALDP